MNLSFYKYQGTGNDFIIIDNRNLIFDVSDKNRIAYLCDRRFGIGADGLMLLQNKKGYDFEMVYFNADGNKSSLCGNGSRCIISFAKQIGVLKKDRSKFLAADGTHEAEIKKDTVSLHMGDVKSIETNSDYYYLNTGSPQYVKFVKGIKSMNVVEQGRDIRNNNRFKKEGVNVNFAEKNGKGIFVRTYERGVEDETLSCGTGVTASALASALQGISTTEKHCIVSTRGGKLTVRFNKKTNSSFTDIWLDGPATFVYKGEIKIN